MNEVSPLLFSTEAYFLENYSNKSGHHLLEKIFNQKLHPIGMVGLEKSFYGKTTERINLADAYRSMVA